MEIDSPPREMLPIEYQTSSGARISPEPEKPKKTRTRRKQFLIPGYSPPKTRARTTIKKTPVKSSPVITRTQRKRKVTSVPSVKSTHQSKNVLTPKQKRRKKDDGKNPYAEEMFETDELEKLLGKSSYGRSTTFYKKNK